MFAEEDYLPLSGVQHYRFCPRQCALIHVEQMWRENFLTAHGRVLHERVHAGLKESRGKLRIERGLRISSIELGLIGQTDAVEFYADGTVCPVEYKRGTKKANNTDRIQLCAQAICLEEMRRIRIEKGFLYYDKTKKREEVVLTEALRDETKRVSRAYHDLVVSKIVPPADYTKRCQSCSLLDDCFPDSAGRKRSVSGYILRTLDKEIGDDGVEE